MRSDFVATLSRYHNGSIVSEHYDDHLSVLTDVFEHWEGAASLIGEELLDVLSTEQSDQVLELLLCGLEPGYLFDRLKAADYGVNSKPMLALVKLILKEMDENTYTPMLQEMGWVKREVSE